MLVRVVVVSRPFGTCSWLVGTQHFVLGYFRASLRDLPAGIDPDLSAKINRALGTATGPSTLAGVYLYFTLNDFLRLEPGFREVVHLLEVHPELRTVAEETAQAQRGIRGNGAPAVHDLADASSRDVNLHGQRVLADLQGKKEFFTQDFAGMGRGLLKTPSAMWPVDRHTPPFEMRLVVIGHFYFMCSVGLPDKANTVLIVDPDAVLTSPVALKCFQPVARGCSKIVQVQRSFYLIQLAQSHLPDGSPSRVGSVNEEFRGVRVPEALNHPMLKYNAKRYTEHVSSSASFFLPVRGGGRRSPWRFL